MTHRVYKAIALGCFAIAALTASSANAAISVIGSGIAELIASILLLIPSLTVYGAILALGVISGAIMAHLTKLGIVVLGDGGLLFGLALIVFFGSLGILFIHRKEIPFIGKLL